MFAEVHRTLAPGGYLLWGDYVGNERLQPTQGYGRPVSYESDLLPLNRMIGLLEQAGLVVTARLEQEPGGLVSRPHACLLARKPETPWGASFLRRGRWCQIADGHGAAVRPRD
ncbi:hypothetical protein [Streptomyces sp. NPDC053069]|uniref:hypothetical protein n=1 Tax=Streptomyces sp. NPDC053069 TaxID=3365695 RepID=UPI0037D4B446